LTNINNAIDVMALSRFLDKASSELGLRILSGVVMATIAIAAALLGGWWLAGLMLILALCIVHEWFAMTGCAGKWAAMAAIVAIWIAMSAYSGGIVLALYLLFMGAVGTAMFSLIRRGGEGGGWAAAGMIYAALPLIALLWIREAEGGGGALLWLFFVIWSTDTAAFIVGKLIKGPKLAPAISPGKTWSGAVGGLVGATVIGVALASLLSAEPGRAASLAVLVSLAAQCGDLLESGIKRRFGVKDSGQLIPGHGGVMDRLDSLVVAGPVFTIVITLFAALTGAMNG
jgi:phosphatidate cytidylyltransferase